MLHLYPIPRFLHRILVSTTLLCLLMVFSRTVTANQQDYVLVNANLIDPHSQTVIEKGWLHVKDKKIVALGQGELPLVPEHVDVQGAYVIPGLIDAHMHLTAGPLKVSVENGMPVIDMSSIDEVTEFHALSTLASGITSAFSPAGDPTANQGYVNKQQSGEWRGPALNYAGLVFDPTPIVGGSVYPKGEQAWQQEIARQKSFGASYIKLYHGLTLEELQMGIRLAEANGLRTIGHLDSVSWTDAANSGISALTHALMTSADLLPEPVRAEFTASKQPFSSKYLYQWFEYVDYDSPEFQVLISTLVENKTQVDLTLVVNQLMHFYPDAKNIFPDDNWRAHPAVADSWYRNLGASLFNWTPEDYQRTAKVFPKVLELAKRFHEAGVNLLIGTDAQGGGRWLAQELHLHSQAGLDNWTLLEMVTARAADTIGFANTGRLNPGYYADLVVLPSNPLENILAVEHPSQVIQQGVWYSVESLKDELRSRTAAIRGRGKE